MEILYINPDSCNRTKAGAFARVIVALFFVGQSGLIIAQGAGTFFGKVIDSKTRQPIRFASVFLANTMMGGSSNENGEYRIERIPYGKYDITVSSIGYKIQQVSVSASSEPVALNFELIEEVRYLKEVTVKAKPFDLKKWRAEFTRRFVGGTPNAKECRIQNLDKVDLDYDEEAKVFSASCSEPIEVENKALGYRIHYLLIQFVVDYRSGRSVIAGIPRFEEMQSLEKAQNRRWQKKRDEAYLGSFNHFMRSAKSGTLQENNFEVYSICDNVKGRVNPDSLFSGDGRTKLVSKCVLEIVYRGKSQRQISQIKLLDGTLTVYDNGYYEDQLRVDVYGYYSTHENIEADLLPLEYQPAILNK